MRNILSWKAIICSGLWRCSCRCECARKTNFPHFLRRISIVTPTSVVVDYFVPNSPSPPPEKTAGDCLENCRYAAVWMFHHKGPGRDCVDVSPLRCFLGFYISLHSKLSLRRLNSWKFHSEGVTHIFLQLRLFKRENNKGKLKAQGKLAKENWIKVKFRESEGKFVSRKSLFRQTKFFVFEIFVRKL